MLRWHDASEEPDESEYGFSYKLLMEVRLFDDQTVYCTGFRDLRKNMWISYPVGTLGENQDVRRWAYLNDILEVLDNG